MNCYIDRSTIFQIPRREYFSSIDILPNGSQIANLARISLTIKERDQIANDF
jgi:hypothetical protein